MSRSALRQSENPAPGPYGATVKSKAASHRHDKRRIPAAPQTGIPLWGAACCSAGGAACGGFGASPRLEAVDTCHEWWGERGPCVILLGYWQPAVSKPTDSANLKVCQPVCRSSMPELFVTFCCEIPTLLSPALGLCTSEIQQNTLPILPSCHTNLLCARTRSYFQKLLGCRMLFA